MARYTDGLMMAWLWQHTLACIIPNICTSPCGPSVNVASAGDTCSEASYGYKVYVKPKTFLSAHHLFCLSQEVASCSPFYDHTVHCSHCASCCGISCHLVQWLTASLTTASVMLGLHSSVNDVPPYSFWFRVSIHCVLTELGPSNSSSYQVAVQMVAVW